jgi:DNA polymerase-1
MASVAVWAKQHGAQVYLCTSDKDMLQVVDSHIHILNTHKDNLISGPKEVEKNFGVTPSQIVDLLAIVGDTSDNVPGIPGFGPKTAAALLKQFGSLEYILDHPEELPEKKREVIIQNRDNARISRRLVTLDTHVHIPHQVDYYSLKPADAAKLKAFFLSMNFNSLIKEIESPEKPIQSAVKDDTGPVTYTTVDDEESFKQLMHYLSKQKEVCFDTEVTHHQAIKSKLVGVAFCVEQGQAWYIPANGKLGLEYILKGLKPLFENPHIGFYGHNVKFDYQVLQNDNIAISTICFDTILASYLLNSHSRQHSLDHLALTYFGKVKIPPSDLVGKGKSVINMSAVPIEKIGPYCCEQADYACRIKGVLEKELKERNLTPLLNDLELPLLKVLAKMERHGMYLDKPCLSLFSKEVLQELKTLEHSIYQQAVHTFNLNSQKQLSEALFTKLGIKAPKKTATGLSTNADVLESLKEKYPIAKTLLEYRTLEKLRSTYLETLPLEVYPKTHRIHSTFNQFVAATGRLSSQDPNLQNIPIRSEIGKRIREAFRPEKEEWSYLAADYSQVELRILAHLSEDPRLIKAFQKNEDIHAATAAAIFGIPIDKVTGEQRHQAKAVNFGLIYGQQAYGLSQALGIEVREASHFIEAYFSQYKKVKEFLEESKDKVRKSGKAVTLIGRERLIPEIYSKNGVLRAAAERLAINAPIQGTAADLIKMAMLEIDKQITKHRLLSYMILQIHDELIFEVPDKEIATLEPLVRETMQEILKLKVPLIVDIGVGKNWKEC